MFCGYGIELRIIGGGLEGVRACLIVLVDLEGYLEWDVVRQSFIEPPVHFRYPGVCIRAEVVYAVRSLPSGRYSWVCGFYVIFRQAYSTASVLTGKGDETTFLSGGIVVRGPDPCFVAL